MKTCPVCKAGAFDDAEVCYGCLHRFSQADAVVAPMNGAGIGGQGGGAVMPGGAAVAAAPAETPRVADVAAEPHRESAKQPSAGSDLVVENVSSDEQGVSQTVSVPVRNADIVVRIELVEASSQASDAAESQRDVACDAPPECVVLRRGRKPYVMDTARPAETKRGVAAGQKGDSAYQARARHAAVPVDCSQRQAEIA